MYVTEIYDFPVIAGQGTTTARSLAAAAAEVATEFFGDIPYDLTIEVTGKKGQWFITAQAKANVKLEDEHDGR